MVRIKDLASQVVGRVMYGFSEGKEGGASHIRLSPRPGMKGSLTAAVFGAPPSLWPWHYAGAVCRQWRVVMIFSSSHHKGHKMDTHPFTIQLEPPRHSPRQGLLCLDGSSHLFISFPREGELMLFGTGKNNVANG